MVYVLVPFRKAIGISKSFSWGMTICGDLSLEVAREMGRVITSSPEPSSDSWMWIGWMMAPWVNL